MIDNTELYSFDDENSEKGYEPEVKAEAETDPVSVEGPMGPIRLVYQTIISVSFLIVILLVCQVGIPNGQWIRARLHSAINSSPETTFGFITNSALYKTVIQNCSNFIRLEDITKQNAGILDENGAGIFKNAVWPVQGYIVKGFGWLDDPTSHIKEYSPGVEMAAPPGTPVLAIAGGTVTETNQQTGIWQLTIDHGQGWKSVYQGLERITVKPGQEIKTGAEIGRLGMVSRGGVTKLSLEVTHNNRPFDPLAMLNNS